MSDLISRQAVLSLPRAYAKNARGKIFKEFINVKDVETLPAAQPERKKGEWIVKVLDEPYLDPIDKLFNSRTVCSVCGYELCGAKQYFCPNCGADMRGDNNEID